jgi:Excalibur calcium-binding domain
MTDPYGPWEDDVDERRHGAPGRRSLRNVFADLVWRYQSARLGTQVTMDVLAACLVMAVVFAGAVLLDRDSGPSVTSTAGPATTVAHAAATTTTTAAPTTAAPTTSAPATTTVPPAPPTTRVPPTTTTAPAPPPATDAPAGPPPPPPTEREEEPGRPYRDCMEAWLARALPLYAGEPGYSRALDGDGDGEACEWDERDERDERD